MFLDRIVRGVAARMLLDQHRSRDLGRKFARSNTVEDRSQLVCIVHRDLARTFNLGLTRQLPKGWNMAPQCTAVDGFPVIADREFHRDYPLGSPARIVTGSRIGVDRQTFPTSIGRNNQTLAAGCADKSAWSDISARALGGNVGRAHG